MSAKTQIAWLGALFLILSVGIVEADTIPAKSGDIEITPIMHGSVMLEHDGMIFYVDPYSKGDYTDAPKADVILVTDIHGDHLDSEMIDRLRKDSTVLVIPAAASGKAKATIVMEIENGESQKINEVAIEAVPMYNHERGPEPGKLYHEKGRGNGYILTLGGKRIYFSGDTACTSEMKALKDIDIAFVTMNLPYTMPPEEAAECVRAFKPAIIYPYHYGDSDLTVFSAALENLPEVEIRLREWYPEE